MYAFDVLNMPVPSVPSLAATDPAGRLADGNVWKTTKYSTHTGENAQPSDKGRISLSVSGEKKLCACTKFSGRFDGHDLTSPDDERLSKG